MTPRETHRDDARPLPQGPRSGSQHAPEDADDVYVVDVRGRGRSAGSGTRPLPVSGPGPRGDDRGRGRPAPSAAQPRRRRRPWGWLVALVVVAWLAFMVGTPLHAWNSVTKVDTTPPGDRPAGGKGYNYLLVGSDSREGLTDEQKKEYATGSAEGRRTDSGGHHPLGRRQPCHRSLCPDRTFRRDTRRAD